MGFWVSTGSIKNHLQSATIELVYLYYEQHRVKRGKANSIVAPCIISGKPILKIYYLQWFPNFLVLYKYARMFADIRHTHRPEIYIINAMFQKNEKLNSGCRYDALFSVDCSYSKDYLKTVLRGFLGHSLLRLID